MMIRFRMKHEKFRWPIIIAKTKKHHQDNATPTECLKEEKLKQEQKQTDCP